ncbi:MAG: hypothetical protein U0232_04445 [Thermomicrobiales bacterium]
MTRRVWAVTPASAAGAIGQPVVGIAQRGADDGGELVVVGREVGEEGVTGGIDALAESFGGEGGGAFAQGGEWEAGGRLVRGGDESMDGGGPGVYSAVGMGGLSVVRWRLLGVRGVEARLG